MEQVPEGFTTVVNKTVYRREISISVMVLGILSLCALAYVVETIAGIFT